MRQKVTDEAKAKSQGEMDYIHNNILYNDSGVSETKAALLTFAVLPRAV